MSHGPKSAKRRARLIRRANAAAHRLGYDGADHLMQAVPPIFRPEFSAVVACALAGYGGLEAQRWARRMRGQQTRTVSS